MCPAWMMFSLTHRSVLPSNKYYLHKKLHRIKSCIQDKMLHTTERKTNKNSKSRPLFAKIRKFLPQITWDVSPTIYFWHANMSCNPKIQVLLSAFLFNIFALRAKTSSPKRLEDKVCLLGTDVHADHKLTLHTKNRFINWIFKTKFKFTSQR